MEMKEFAKNLEKLNEAIEDFLDNMEPEQPEEEVGMEEEVETEEGV